MYDNVEVKNAMCIYLQRWHIVFDVRKHKVHGKKIMIISRVKVHQAVGCIY